MQEQGASERRCPGTVPIRRHARSIPRYSPIGPDRPPAVRGRLQASDFIGFFGVSRVTVRGPFCLGPGPGVGSRSGLDRPGRVQEN
jgi:hypothetical protein